MKSSCLVFTVLCIRLIIAQQDPSIVRRKFSCCSRLQSWFMARFAFLIANTRVCSSVARLLNARRAYMKSVCEMRVQRNYTDAANYCDDKGMELFRVSSGELRTALFNFSYPRYQLGAGSVIWVNGSFDCSALFNGFGPFREVDYSCERRNFFLCGFVDKMPTHKLMNLTEILTK